MVFEVVVESLAEARLAESYGAKRIELCSALDLGGLTPGAGLIKSCTEHCSLEVHAMIRPRGGGFIYSADEIEIMEREIGLSAQYGCKGAVFGILNSDYSINVPGTERLVKKAKSLQLEVTVHRAIDFSTDMYKSLEDIISCGADRILTAGHVDGVDKGMATLEKMLALSAGRIQVMAGGGVNPGNVPALLKLRPDAIHFNVRKVKPGRQDAAMGNEYETDESKIKEIKSLLDNFSYAG